ncbi:MAG: hypothetical protein M3Y32_00395 [Pseudomonadota bacterium]|nr:hypothetical protein [Pseudomonadota bacterium]
MSETAVELRFRVRMAALLLMALSATSACTAPKAGCSVPTELEPGLCDARLPPVRSVAIEKNGALQEGIKNYEYDCSVFVLDEKAVRRYFARTRRVDGPNPNHDVAWSACHASGTLRFSDGRRADWLIEQSSVARLWIAGADAIVLYCPDCDFAPFTQ